MRTYAKTTKEPEGRAERLDRCIAYADLVPGYRQQCSRLRGHGPSGNYCERHARAIAKGKKVFVPESGKE